MFQKYSLVLLTGLLLFLGGCGTDTDSKYPRWVGDIAFDPNLDNKAFRICLGENRVQQYFHVSEGLPYEGEKPALVRFFRENYHAVEVAESGWIRVRFIVNCEGTTGRFRILEADENYQPFTFDPRISDQLLELSRRLTGWKIQPNQEKPRDYYQYLVFKIEAGQLTDILP
jgi:hypothetical protein